MSSVEGIDGDISSRYVRDFISETGGEEVLGMDERDVLILNFSFYLATFFLLSIACVVFVIRHKGIPPAFIRSYFHIFIIGFAVFRVTWAALKLFHDGKPIPAQFFLGRTAFCLFFSAFISVVVMFAEVAFGLYRRGKWTLRICVSILNIIIYAFIFAILIVISIDDNQADEGVVLYEFSIIIVVAYSLVCAVGFLLFGVLILLKIFCFSRLRQIKKLVVSALWLTFVTVVCTTCLALRFAIFLYRPVTGELFPPLIFYMYGYWVPELPVAILLTIIMREPKDLGRKRMNRSDRTLLTASLDETMNRSDIFQSGGGSVDEMPAIRLSTLVSPNSRPMSPQRDLDEFAPLLAFDAKNEDTVEDPPNTYLQISTTIQLKGNAQPRVALFYDDPTPFNSDNPEDASHEMQTTETIFSDVKVVRFNTLFDIPTSDPNQPLWFSVFTSVFQEVDSDDVATAEEKMLSTITNNPDDAKAMRELTDTVDSSTKQVSVGSAMITVGGLLELGKHSCCQLDLLHDNAVTGIIIFSLENVTEDKAHPQVFRKSYVFHNTDGNKILMKDVMCESPMPFDIAYQFLRIIIPKRKQALQQFQATYEQYEARQFESRKGAAFLNVKDVIEGEEELQAAKKWYDEQLQLRIDDLAVYEDLMVLYKNYSGEIDNLTFKPSTYKSNKPLRFISTNLHYQEMQILDPETSNPTNIYEHVTFGAPAAHVYKFHSGMRMLELKIEKLQKKLTKENNLVIISRLQRQLEQFNYELQRRADVSVTQAAAALCTVFSKKVEVLLRSEDKGSLILLHQYAEIGFLVEFESLLSTYGSEMGMLGDFDRSVSMLSQCKFELLPCPQEMKEDAVDCCHLPSKVILSSSQGQFIFQLYLPPDMFDKLPPLFRRGGNQVFVDVFPILFSQGINEFQTIANTVGDTSLQEAINRESFPKLQEYLSRYINFWRNRSEDPPVSFNKINVMMSRIQKSLKNVKREKNVDLIVLPADICRKLGGGRITCCKSAKDRTSMSVTYEQARLLHEYHDMAEDERTCADALRSTGIRRMNACKNIGKNKFAFNNFQRKLLPEMFKPPLNCLGGDVPT